MEKSILKIVFVGLCVSMLLAGAAQAEEQTTVGAEQARQDIISLTLDAYDSPDARTAALERGTSGGMLGRYGGSFSGPNGIGTYGGCFYGPDFVTKG